MSDARLATRHVLEPAEWTAREARHRQRAARFLDPHEQRTRSGQPHPVWDFLFTYYSLKPRQLRRWHPGFGVGLRDADNYLGRSGYDRRDDVVGVTDEHLAARLDTVEFIAGLLAATTTRATRLNCFGLHEWAMVYRAARPRHNQVPLRLGRDGTDAVVESMPLRCSHFDAYRFFTPDAVGRNSDVLSRGDQAAHEQPGCVHVNMDLHIHITCMYEHAWNRHPLRRLPAPVAR